MGTQRLQRTSVGRSIVIGMQPRLLKCWFVFSSHSPRAKTRGRARNTLNLNRVDRRQMQKEKKKLRKEAKVVQSLYLNFEEWSPKFKFHVLDWDRKEAEGIKFAYFKHFLRLGLYPCRRRHQRIRRFPLVPHSLCFVANCKVKFLANKTLDSWIWQIWFAARPKRWYEIVDERYVDIYSWVWGHLSSWDCSWVKISPTYWPKITNNFQ